MLTRLRRAVRSLAPAAALAVFTTGAWADGPSDLSRLAPPKPLMTLSIPDFSKLRAGFDESELGKLWAEPGVRAFVEEASGEMSKKLGEFLKELGAESKDLKPPTGAVGIALYLPESKPKAGEDPQPFDPDMFFVADAGENSQSWKDLLDRLIDRGVRDKELTLEEDTYAGARITVLKPTYKAPETAPDKAAEGDEPPPPEPGGFAGFVGGSAERPRAFHIAWSANTVIAASTMKQVEGALDAMGGREINALGGDPEYKAALAQHPAGAHAILTFDLGQLIRMSMEEAQAARARMGSDAAPLDMERMLDYLGVGRMGPMSLGLRMDAPDAVVEMSMGILVPEKKGVFALLSEPLGAFEPPAFIPADAAAVTRFSFRFEQLYDLIRGLAPFLPDEQRAAFAGALEQGVNLVKPAVDVLGPGVWFVQSFRQPLTADSAMTLVAIDVKDPGIVSNTLTFLVGQAQGFFEPREFEGNTIYSAELVGMSVGQGFNRLFIGNTPAVETAMRLAGRADAPRLGEEAGFKAAVRTVGTDAMMQSYSDMAQSLKFQYWTLQNMDKEFERMIEESGMDAESKAEVLKDHRENRATWPDKLPPLETILAHIGDAAGDLRPTPDGFRGRSVILRPNRR